MAPVSNMINFLLCAFLTFPLVSGAGFDIPSGLPRNLMKFRDRLSRVTSSYDNQLETPMQLRFIAMNNVGIWNCMAAYDETYLDALTNQRPAVTAPTAVINQLITDKKLEEIQLTCAAYAVWQTFLSYAPYSSREDAVEYYAEIGLDTSYIDMNTDVSDCQSDPNEADCLSEVADTYGYTPDIMASIIAYQNKKYLATDGWNQDGSLDTDGNPRTGNYKPYGDITNYSSVPDDDTRWRPMYESNGLGFFYHYDHVVPHIGQTAALKLLTRTQLINRESPDPQYNYTNESNLVIERLAETADNDTRKMLVEFFDAKKQVTARIIGKIEKDFDWSWQEKQLFIMGYTASQYDAMVAAWKEKRRWDLVRPTTVIKSYGDEDITTYAGPYMGLQSIKAKDFEAYQRVMPHSEYPSGSGCICMSGSEYALKWLSDRYGKTEDDLRLKINWKVGSSGNEPGETPASDISFNITGLTAIYKLCGETRLWGGMHYTGSVQGAFDLCQGIGDIGYDYATNLETGDGSSSFGATAAYPSP